MIRQPRVPNYEGGSLAQYIHDLILFLKNYCLAVWKELQNLNKKVEEGGSGAAPVTSVNGHTGAVNLTASDVGAKPSSYTAPVSSVNGQTGAVQLTASDVGARADTWMPNASDVGARSDTWMPSASDVGAMPSTYTAPVTKVNNMTGNITLKTLTMDGVTFNASSNVTHNLVDVSPGSYTTATLNTTNAAAQGGTRFVKWIAWGRYVKVDYWFQLASSCSSTYTDYVLASGLPTPQYDGQFCGPAAMNSGSNVRVGHFKVNNSGQFILQTRTAACNGYYAQGSCFYVKKN